MIKLQFHSEPLEMTLRDVQIKQFAAFALAGGLNIWGQMAV